MENRNDHFITGAMVLKRKLDPGKTVLDWYKGFIQVAKDNNHDVKEHYKYICKIFNTVKHY